MEKDKKLEQLVLEHTENEITYRELIEKIIVECDSSIESVKRTIRIMWNRQKIEVLDNLKFKKLHKLIIAISNKKLCSNAWLFYAFTSRSIDAKLAIHVLIQK